MRQTPQNSSSRAREAYGAPRGAHLRGEDARAAADAARVSRESRVRPDRAGARPAEERRQASEEESFDPVGAVRAAGEVLYRFRVPLIAVVAVAAILAALYGPAQTYYVAWRTGAGLQRQLDELNSSNEQYQQDIQDLQTREGIEDEARRRGYVSEGETKVVVEGLPSEESEAEGDGSDAADERPWYIKLGDTVFHFTG